MPWGVWGHVMFPHPPHLPYAGRMPNTSRRPASQFLTRNRGAVWIRTPQRKDAYTSLHQDPREYLTTTQVCSELNVGRSTVNKWCLEWFGELGVERRGRGMGHRIPHEYWPVVVFYAVCSDANHRAMVMAELLEDPRPYVVVLDMGQKEGSMASTHLTEGSAVERVGELAPHATKHLGSLHVYYAPYSEYTIHGGVVDFAGGAA